MLSAFLLCSIQRPEFPVAEVDKGFVLTHNNIFSVFVSPRKRRNNRNAVRLVRAQSLVPRSSMIVVISGPLLVIANVFS